MNSKINKKLYVFVEVLLYVIGLIGVVSLFFLPRITKEYLFLFGNDYSESLSPYLLSLLYITGILAILVVWELIKIFRTLNTGNPFLLKNSYSFQRISIYVFVVALAYVSKIVLLNSILTVILVLILFIASLFSFILSQVFKQAVEYKQEIDLTVWGEIMIIVNLDVIMAKRKISLTDLCEKIGITLSNISILKTNKAKAIRFSTLEALCRELDCQPGDILEYKEN